MSLTSRLTEYGLLGAFFIISQFALIFFVFPAQSMDGAVITQEVASNMATHLSISQSTVDSLVTAISLVAIFFVGLLLDLIGYYIPMIEIASFKKLLEKNRPWLEKFFREHNEFIHKDTEEFLNIKDSKTMIKEIIRVIPFSKKYWKLAKENWSFILFYKNYRVIIGFLTQYCLTASNTFNSQVLLDQMHIWRISKGISTALMILSLELFFVGMINGRGQVLQYDKP